MGKFIQYRTKESLYDGPFDGKVGWAAAGMGDVIVTGEGRLIVVDGGHDHDAEDFIALLEAQTDGQTPEIDLWIITHAHGDHYGALRAISRRPELSSRIRVKKLLYHFPMDFCRKDGTPGALSGANREMEEIAAVLQADVHCPSRDERFRIDDTEIRMVYVPDDCSVLNTSNGNVNYCSLIFTVQGAQRKVMVTGDAFGRSLQITAWRYGTQLQCDVLQMPHHALCDAYCVDFYLFVRARTVLLPISSAGYRAMHTEYAGSEGGIANLCVEALAEEVYKAFEGTVELPL